MHKASSGTYLRRSNGLYLAVSNAATAAMKRAEEARILANENGLGYKRTARHFGVSRDTARRWLDLDRTNRLSKRQYLRAKEARRPEKLKREGFSRGLDDQIAMRWNRGDMLKEIGATIGLSSGAVAQRIRHMRLKGWNLQVRRRDCSAGQTNAD